MESKSLFLRWALINVLYVIALVVGKVMYSRHIPAEALTAIIAVFATYAVASVQLGLSAWRKQQFERIEARFLGAAIQLTPMIAMLGTISGFLIAFSGDSADIQARVTGASTGLIATFVGIATTVVLMIQRHVLMPHED